MKRVIRLPLRVLSAAHSANVAQRLQHTNRSSRKPLLQPDGPVVSLTSYGDRVQSVHLTIESIGRGKLLPSKLILWLDNERVYRNLADPLVRLRSRGLEIRLTENFGPHTKYYPYVENEEHPRLPLVTADDDILYPPHWLQQLAQAYNERPDLINCYRARVVAFEADGLAPYEQWSLCRSTTPSIRHFATGVSGVIYPPEFLSSVRNAGRAFQECCPKADDIWLHLQALRAGFQVRQFVERALHFPMTPGSQRIALQDTNRGTVESGNDRQASLTYTLQDLILLRASCTS